MRARTWTLGFGRFLALLLIIGFLLGLVYGWPKTAPAPPPTRSTEPEEPIAMAPSNGEPPEMGEEGKLAIRVGTTTKFRYLVRCLPSGSQVVLEGVAPLSALGLDLDQFHSLYPEWQVVRFSPEEVEVRAEVEADPKVLTNSLFLGVHEGMVAVFFGAPGGKIRFLKEVTAISVQALLPEDRRRLEAGVPTDANHWKDLLAGLTE